MESKANPVLAIFAHRRPDHLAKVLKSLSLNSEASNTTLYIFIDGPRSPKEAIQTQAVANIANNATGFKAISIVERKQNVGLYFSLTSGISEVLASHEEVIVIEDDVVVSPNFLKFMLDGLRTYKSISIVASIHGYTPPIKHRLPTTFFLRGADCWGWGTWRDRWALFREDAGMMAKEIRDQNLEYEFNLLGCYPYLQMLEDRANGINNSWAICWHASCFLAGKLTLYPGKSLVSNIGLDYSGENCGPSDIMDSAAYSGPINVRPVKPQVNRKVFEIYAKHFCSSTSTANYTLKVIGKLKSRLHSFVSSKPHKGLILNGPFSNYDQALNSSTGYSSSVILDKVEHALTRLIQGHGNYERDGTLFTSSPVNLKITSLIQRYLRPNSKVIDFGGGLGGLYLNHRELFDSSINYTVVEQPSFVNAGKRFAALHNLPIFFENTLSAIVPSNSIIILSSVLTYVPNLEEIIVEVLRLAPDLIIVDRTAVIWIGKQRWWVQDEPTYYDSPISYPIRPLREGHLLRMFKGYKVIEEWINPFDASAPLHKGFLLKRI